MGKNRVFPEKSHAKRKSFSPKLMKYQGKSESQISSRSSVGDFFIKSGNNNHNNPDKEKDAFLTKNSHNMISRKLSKQSDNTIRAHNEDIVSERTSKESIHDVVSKTSKKPFDKKKYRLQKYSKKYKVEQWEDKRKKAVLREYYNSVKDEPKLNVSEIYKKYDIDSAIKNEENTEVQHPLALPQQNPKGKTKPFKKVQEEFQRIKQEKEMKRNEFLQKKAEREEAIKKLKKEKAEKYRKLSRKTKKGQPIMKERMEMLLEKIQKMT